MYVWPLKSFMVSKTHDKYIYNIYIIFTEYLNIQCWSCVQITYSINKYKLFRHNFVSDDGGSACPVGTPPCLQPQALRGMNMIVFFTAGLGLNSSGDSWSLEVFFFPPPRTPPGNSPDATALLVSVVRGGGRNDGRRVGNWGRSQKGG